MFNNCKINKTHTVKKTYYNFNDNIALTKTIHRFSNDTYTITENIDLYDVTDNNYYTKKPIIPDTSIHH